MGSDDHRETLIAERFNSAKGKKVYAARDSKIGVLKIFLAQSLLNRGCVAQPRENV
jgi:hypothetical protein